MSEELTFEELSGGGNVDVIRVHGRLDTRMSPLLMERCIPARDGGRNLILNLRAVSFLSSSGIGSLLVLTEEFRERGITLSLAETSPTVQEAIELMNLQTFLVLCGTEDEAVREQAA